MSDLVTDPLERSAPVPEPADQRPRQPDSRARRKPAPRSADEPKSTENAPNDEPPHQLDDMA